VEGFADKIKRAYWLRQQAASLTAEADEILDGLGELPTGKYPAGEFIFQVTPTVRFDASTAQRHLSPDEFESILKRTPNAALAKALLGEDRYKATQKVYGQTRKIIPVTDEE
jgi:hypothetical protein